MAPTSKVASLAGRRILMVGDGLSRLSGDPLKGAATQNAPIETLSEARDGRYDLAVIDADACDPAALAAAVQALSQVATAPPVLLVGERIPMTVVRSLMRLERSDVLEAPFSAEQFLAAATGLLSLEPLTAAPAAPAAPAVVTSRCWAVTGAVGGAGATTLAVEIATALAARGAERSVCLIDLNFADGAASAYLGAQPAMRLTDFNGASERIDATVLQAFVTPVTKQLDLYATPRDPDAFDAVTRESVLRLLEVACETYAYVILDLPRHRRAWTLEAIAGADEVLVISELTVPALIAARSLAEEMEASAQAKPRIVLNRLASRMFGPAPSMSEAEKALQRKADAGVSSDWEAAAAAANLGGAIAQHRPKSKIVKDIATLVDRLADAPTQKDAAARRVA